MIHYFDFSMKGCGTAGGCPILKNTAFTITEHSDLSVPLEIEGGEEPYTIKLEGADSTLFNIHNKVITTKSVLDYENPLDADFDNTYNINITVFDSKGRGSTTPVTVTVDNNPNDNITVNNPDNLDSINTVYFNRTLNKTYLVYLYEADGGYIVNNSPIELKTSEGFVDGKTYKTLINDTTTLKSINIGNNPFLYVNKWTATNIKNLTVLGTGGIRVSSVYATVHIQKPLEFWYYNGSPLSRDTVPVYDTTYFETMKYVYNDLVVSTEFDTTVETVITLTVPEPNTVTYMKAEDGDLDIVAGDLPFEVYQNDELLEDLTYETTLEQSDTEYKLVFKEEQEENV